MNPVLAFSLAFVASLGTFIGGVLVCLLALFGGKATSSNSLIGILQAASAGVMLYMVFLEYLFFNHSLVPESVEKIGQYGTMIYFFVGLYLVTLGVAIFALLETLVSEGHDHEDHEQSSLSDSDEPLVKRQGLRKRKSSTISKKTESKTKLREKRELKRMGMVYIFLIQITFLALFIHNIPEGLGVYLAAMADEKLGVELAVAIMLHNIPEGMACAIPLWASTRSYSYVLLMTLLNGLAEPIGVVIGGYLLKDHMTPEILSKCLAMVAGIMACISLHELHPTAIAYAGKNYATGALFTGMLATFLALELVHSMMHNGHVH